MENPLKESISKRLEKERLKIPSEEKVPKKNYMAVIAAAPIVIALIFILLKTLF
ncbi:hypothetical protein ACVRW7_01575 [Streptococcus ratti]|uniref:Accessory secretory protein Asp4 n=1 Tax=Streptococcus ratti FA-1 = DSM 20564 TaxID=699248 RepID=A0ABN0GTF7_STRRT|nr:hypothetical protein [Streptococcus ratti]EJN93697.1 hypothetical protein SRA_04146 [Streptococcus ratti FA-1 = DSM 20564]VEI60009.1 Uncharacterised protein [Streptococcus mutans]